jgi:hypothetical protein
MCQEYRKMEDHMVDRQREDPKPHCEFRQSIEVFARDLEKTKVSKRGIFMSELSRTGQAQRTREQRELELDQLPDLVEFKAWLQKQPVRPGHADTLAASTVDHYYAHVRRRFFNGANVEDVERRARETMVRLQTKNNMTSTESDELNAMRYFTKFRTDPDPGAE